MDETTEDEEYEPKISGIEAMLMILVALLFDALDIAATFLDFVVGMGEFIKPAINVVASTILFVWVKLKGVSALRTIAGAGLELVPFVNALPIRTVTMIATIWLDRHPKEAEIAEVILPTPKNPRGGKNRPSKITSSK